MASEIVERLKRFLSRRKHDYQIVFNLESEQAQRVLKDLSKFCRAHQSTFHQDARANALLEGRREVWLRIQQHLNIDSETLWKIYNRGDE